MAETTHAEAGVGRERPLSPHLQIYRRSIHMMMSIVHRITGGALYFGSLLLAAWLMAAAAGPDAFNFVNDLAGSILGRLVLLGYTWAVVHHMLGGIRHFIWDTGHGFDLDMVKKISWATLIGSVVLTILIWIVGLKILGG